MIKLTPNSNCRTITWSTEYKLSPYDGPSKDFEHVEVIYLDEDHPLSKLMRGEK